MSRLTRLVTIVTTFIAATVLSAPAALALVAPRPPVGFTGPAAIAPTVVTTTTGSGMATWAIVLIALAAVATGVLLAETFRAVGRRTHNVAAA
jgi:hypothetical protein